MPSGNEARNIEQSLQTEYREVAAFIRQFMVVRFATLAFSITLLAFLVGVYQYVLTMPEEQLGIQVGEGALLRDLRTLALQFIPLIGVLTTIALQLLDWRIRKLYFHSCLQRGETIEKALGLDDAHISRLRTTPQPLKFITHTRVISFFYELLVLIWAYLYWLSI
ncbi:MAG: hypothetical protein AAB469_00655 [Patescibacteria group bacterium]